MSQVAVMGLGEASGYAIYEHHSEAKAWSVTVGEPATAVFDDFEACLNADCKYPTGELIHIARNRVKNTGDFSGTINIKFEELDSAGNPLPSGVRCSGSVELAADETARLGFDEILGMCKVEKSTDSGLVRLAPRSVGTYYFGIKTWSDDETEPPYPSPTAALSGAEVLPVAGGEGLAIPVTVVSGVALVGLAMLARKRKLF